MKQNLAIIALVANVSAISFSRVDGIMALARHNIREEVAT